MTPAATKACFSDFRIVKGRKVCQLVFELPIEAADEALQALGGLPQPATERWFGIARLTEEAARKPDARERYANASEGEQAVTRAALLCEDEDFCGWVRTRAGSIFSRSGVTYWLREQCGIKSRAELATNPDALKRFLELETRFRYGDHATR